MYPKLCAYCAVNFMDHTIEKTQKLCNNCLPKEKKMSHSQILIDVSREIQIEIEDHCINEGYNFSDYFVSLHKANMEKLGKNKVVLLDSENDDEKKIQKTRNKK